MFPDFVKRGFGWLQETVSGQAQYALLTVLAAGPLPKHVAFVMDGNRRYARRQHQAVSQGHSDGFAALRRVRGSPYLLCRRAPGVEQKASGTRDMHAFEYPLRISVCVRY